MKNLIRQISLIAILCFAVCTTAADTNSLRLGATTTTYDSGLLNYLLNQFTQDTQITVKPIITGTGQALRNAERGDVDILLVHSPKAEATFMHQGHGHNREAVMHNDFVFVGPANDPAGIRNAESAAAALLKIYQSPTTFISRDDDSGTYHTEVALWQSLQMTPGQNKKNDTYIRAGMGMGRTLQMAEQLQAYTLVDRGTWLNYRQRMTLTPLFSDSDSLRNQYSVIVVKSSQPLNSSQSLNSEPSFHHAKQLQNWLTGQTGQTAIQRFRVQGEVAFVPEASFFSAQ